jgi:hypothetical protein
MTSSVNVQPQVLTGTLNGYTSVTRQPGHNTGAFVQTQVGVGDRLFLTYGLRAEWNPNYGADVLPNYAPRFGAAYTQSFNAVTAKLRGSYGQSTRPPGPTQKVGQRASNGQYWSYYAPYYDDYDATIANPELTPEHQQGGEGGLELYFGTRGSLIVTRYNQTVDGLIVNPKVDSVRSRIPTYIGSGTDAAGYGYFYQSEYLNIGTIRNQGWELQGSVNLGPVTTRGTYSWTKSRTIGINSKYASQFSPSSYPELQPGATFRYLPEHTWALGMTYAVAATTIDLSSSWSGRLVSGNDSFYLQNLDANIRLSQNQAHLNYPNYVSFNNPHALVDVKASRRITSYADGLLQVQNLTNDYTNDIDASNAVIGRQTKLGFRLRL